MNDGDRKEFAEIMLGLAENFSAELTKPGLRLRFEALKQYPIDQVRDAALKIVRGRVFTKMPTVGEFETHLNNGGVSIEDAALVQANMIISHLQEFGAGKFPPIEDPITKHLMTKRWPYYRWGAEVIESELKWWTKEFCEAYRAHSGAAAHGLIDAPKQLKLLASGVGKAM